MARRIFISCFFFLLSAVSVSLLHAATAAYPNLSPAEQQWLESNPVIRVVIDPDYRPVEYLENGKHTGLTKDYLDLLAQRLPVKFKLVPTSSWSESYQYLIDRKADIAPIVSPTPQREIHLAFSNPYTSMRSVFIQSTGAEESISSIEDLNGRKVAIVEGYYWADLIKNKYPEITVVPVRDMIHGLQEAAFGTVDAYLGSFATASYYISEEQITNLKVATYAPEFDATSDIAIRKDWPELVSILNKTIATISDDELNQIHNKWIGLDYEPSGVNTKLLWTIFGLFTASIITLLLSLLWSASLQRQVSRKTSQLKNLNDTLELKVFERTEDLRRANQKLRDRQDNLRSINLQLEDEANRDELTGIANRRHLDSFLTNTIENNIKNGLPVSVFMIDIDHFKLFNDYYGHLIGDDCLRTIATSLHHFAKRTGELAARFGGEEFTLVMSGMNKDKSLEYAKNLLHEIRSLQVEHIKNPNTETPYVTISMGIYTVDKDSVAIEPEKVLELSDQALYAAKNSGRNRAVHYSDINTI